MGESGVEDKSKIAVLDSEGQDDGYSARMKELEAKRNQLKQTVDKTMTEAGGAQEESEETMKSEVSARAIGRLMGLATVSELRLLDAKLDSISSRMESVVGRVDKCMEQISKLPSGSDHERVEVQLASIRSQLKELLQHLVDEDK